MAQLAAISRGGGKYIFGMEKRHKEIPDEYEQSIRSMLISFIHLPTERAR